MVRLKSAFSLIELVLSIIIMGIVSVSVPMIIKISSKATQDALVAEPITNAKMIIDLVNNASFACKYVDDIKSFGIPRYILKNDVSDLNYEVNNQNVISKNFYTKYNIDGTNRRKFELISILQPVVDNSCNDSVMQYNNYSKEFKTAQDANRDFILDAEYKINVKDTLNSNILSQTCMRLDGVEKYDVKVIRLNVSSFGKEISFCSMVFNIGESPEVKVLTWQ
ncbi:type II secretion system protein [Campylobacter majalis]|uniref:type II secretion system protein n=1 Tax=Campylobacter majalis TaxID=2790656 RepID=UPI003D69E9CD